MTDASTTSSRTPSSTAASGPLTFLRVAAVLAALGAIASPLLALGPLTASGPLDAFHGLVGNLNVVLAVAAGVSGVLWKRTTGNAGLMGHALSLPLEGQLDLPHPYGVGVLLPHVTAFNLAVLPEKVKPLAEKIHREDLLVPREIVDGLKELGCFGLSIPQAYGGIQPDDKPDNMGMVVVTEELSRGSLAAAGSLDVAKAWAAAGLSRTLMPRNIDRSSSWRATRARPGASLRPT